MPNGVTGEDAAETLSAEPCCARALARLAGYDADRAGGLFTFGGTATNLYAFNVGISKAQPDHAERGLAPGLAVVGSWPAHYSHKSACAWLGIGTRNYVAAASLPDQTTDLESLESVCRDVLERGQRLACIVGAGGTTSNMAVDDFAKIAAMRDRLAADYRLDYRPHVHADTVVGWAYLCFLDYDLERNPLGFSPPVVAKLSRLVDRLRTVCHADSFGADFHKTGFAPYTSSMIVMRDARDFSRLRRDGAVMTPLFHDKDAYNPGTFTLETSRSAANMVATWSACGRWGSRGCGGCSVARLKRARHSGVTLTRLRVETRLSSTVGRTVRMCSCAAIRRAIPPPSRRTSAMSDRCGGSIGTRRTCSDGCLMNACRMPSRSR